MKSRPVFLLVVLFIFSIVAGFFSYPQYFGANFLPWRLGLDLVGGTHLVYDIDLSSVAAGDRESVVNGLRDVIETRVNLFGVSEPQVLTAQSGDSYRLIVELAGIKDVSEAIKTIGLTPYLYFAENNLVKDSTQPPSFNPTKLTGRYITKASLNFDNLGRPEISLSFNSEGAKLFEDITAKNVGKNLAVILDKEVITNPVVNQKISGGNAVITGTFTIQEARAIVERFNAGALPAPINLISQTTINGSLGGDALNKTLFAGAIGTGLIMLFMILYYHTLGLFASIALLIYIAFTTAIFKLFGITMSLSGIAGFLLSIGMAVDANVLIFERTKEEIKKGLPRISAIEEGFKRAWTSIRDSNLTTIISAVVLYYFTSSFVRGFALTLLIGVLASMFSAITVTRTLLRVFVRNNKLSPKPTNNN